MSGRAHNPDPIPPEHASGGPARAKARILLPIALSVAVLTIFLIAFWPDSHGGKKGHSRHSHASDRGGSPVGGSYREDPEGTGNASVTKGAGSPVGGGDAPARSGSKAEGWWYRDDGKSSRDKGDQWWYHDKKDEPAGADRKPARESEAPKNSGPDDNWWHD